MREAQATFSVAIVGFNETERIVLASIFNLSVQRTPAYVAFDSGAERPDLYLVDADDSAAIASLGAVNGNRAVRTLLVGGYDRNTGWPVIERPLQWARLFTALDAAAAAPAPTDIVQVAASLPSAAQERTSLRVLVVDDSASVRQFMTTKLEQFGIAVECATSGEEAIGRVAANRYDAILLDIGLPGIDGFETCRALKSPRSPARAPVIMLTARDASLDRWRATLAGCDGYLTKPVESIALRATLERVLGREFASELALEQ